MNELTTLGLEIPSSAYMLGLLVFGIVGWIVYRRGRKVPNPVLTWLGVALMVYPYGVSQTWLLWAAGGALCGCVYAKWE